MSSLSCCTFLSRYPTSASKSAVLSSAASRTDLEGVRTAATLLRNLAMPIASRTRLTAAADVLGVLRAHVAHRDPNTAAVVAAALRLLVEGRGWYGDFGIIKWGYSH